MPKTCDHNHMQVLPGGRIRCGDCGEILTEDETEETLDFTKEQ